MFYSDKMYALNTDPNPTEGKVLELLNMMVEHKHESQIAMPVAEFWKPDDLAAFEQALAWWPEDAPPVCRKPMLGEMCHAILRTDGQPPMTFASYLAMRGQRCVVWLKQEGRNVEKPNETKLERKRRQGREAMARYRSTTKRAETDPAAAELKQLWQVYMDACAARKAVAAEQDLLVRAAYADWEKAKAELSAPNSSEDQAPQH